MNTLTIACTIGAFLLLCFLLLITACWNNRRPRLARQMFPVSTRVRHPLYGCGTVVSIERPDGMLLVGFDGHRENVQLVARWNLCLAKKGETGNFTQHHQTGI